MNLTTVPLYSVAAVRELDRLIIASGQVTGYALMERAGAALFARLEGLAPANGHVLILCGGGNNGGDGFIVARLAKARGYSVELLTMKDVTSLTGDARLAADDWTNAGGQTQSWDPLTFQRQLQAANVVVDALLGTGLQRAVTGAMEEVIKAVNASRKMVLAVDVPSGLNADSGVPMGVAIKATETVTFVGCKMGLVTGSGPDFTGQLIFDSLGAEAIEIRGVPQSAGVIKGIDSALGPRMRNSHKGGHGHVVAVGGSSGMVGAIRLAGRAALRAGAGLVTIATHPAHATALNLISEEMMVRSFSGNSAHSGFLASASVLALGPGLGDGEWAETAATLSMDAGVPLVVDADALNWLAANPRTLNNAVITPHPGEAARLLGISSEEVQSDRYATAAALVERYQSVVVLKGCGTIIAAPGKSPLVCPRGNPGMASAGMGDVLTGVIAALLAQGLDPYQAAIAGVWIHASAGDLAAVDGERGMIASDLLNPIRQMVNTL